VRKKRRLFHHVNQLMYLSLYIISLVGRPFHPFVSSSIPSSIHPSSSSRKKMMMEEEEEGGGRMVAAAVYPNVYVIQSSSNI
jgi:hypothetical protein